MTVIAFFGMGLLGSNFVRAMRKRGLDVTVWNRSPERAKPLAEAGARVATDPADAVKGATQLHLTLSDDAAVDDVLERAKAGFGPGLTIIDHTTTSPAGTEARAARWAERGVAFQHAPVFMGPANALEASGMMLASGDKAQFDRLQPDLAKMTGKLLYLGPGPSRASAFKLFGNLFLMAMTTGVADLLGLAKALGIDAADAGALFETFNPAASMTGRVKKIVSGDYANASWELAMARKDARLMLEAAQAGGVKLKIIPAIAEEMDRWIQKGHAHDDWTVIASDSVKR
jgi:3-hydroxyisobutyrate dehydrogenase